MSIHPSLKSNEKDKKQRSVLKRAERIKMMLDKGKWKEGDGVFGLPKIKTLKIKIKKEKAEKTETPGAAGAETAAAPAAAAPAAKGAAAKGAGAKAQEKK
ncbi:MAG: small basic protein [Candidatus Omnitrophica bacterium]|jgi:small basic protein (TIGR04137 family)|nr:small basic protein [Candidatus Omnitrophota bacterium]MDD5512412.1 small basic protein [Candidatus Omnitrophota bacterium]